MRVSHVEGRVLLVLAADLRAQLLPKLVGNLQKDLDHGRIELRSRAAQNLPARLSETARLTVGTVACNGVKSVDNCEDPRSDGDLAPTQVVWIPASVVMLLMTEDDLRGSGKKRDLAQHVV